MPKEWLLSQFQLNLKEIAKITSVDFAISDGSFYMPDKNLENWRTYFLGTKNDCDYVVDKGKYATKSFLVENKESLSEGIQLFLNNPIFEPN